MSLPCHEQVATMSLPCRGHIMTTSSPWHGHLGAMSSPQAPPHHQSIDSILSFIGSPINWGWNHDHPLGTLIYTSKWFHSISIEGRFHFNYFWIHNAPVATMCPCSKPIVKILHRHSNIKPCACSQCRIHHNHWFDDPWMWLLISFGRSIFSHLICWSFGTFVVGPFSSIHLFLG